IKLASRGFNTPDFEAVYDVDDLKKHEKQFMAWNRVSIRTDVKYEAKKQFLLPHCPNLIWHEALHAAEDILKKNSNYIIIASKGINSDRSLCAGKYHVGTSEEYIECYFGPGTIRDMETSKVDMLRIDMNYIKSFPIDKAPLEMIPFSQILQKMRHKGEMFMKPYLLEFSIYPDKIGKKSERIIFWELINL
ncbi:MAG: hypothetical protein KAR20_29510, partial [Candidatus Heimdallarchaeota archaeon]|nr:hypothetical protein [Candidatus Heimdallarchaeota archaeon]